MRISSKNSLAQKFSGTLLGAAIGDSLAFPYQDYSRSFLNSLAQTLTEEYSRHHSGFYPQGQCSDDTQVMLAVVDTLLLYADESPVTPLDSSAFLRHLLPLWRDQVLVERDPSCAEAMERLLNSETRLKPQPLETGRAEISPVGRTVGAALWTHHDLETLHATVKSLVRMTHADQRPLACAAAFAAAVAHNVTTKELILGPFLDQVGGAAGRYDPQLQELIMDFPRLLTLTEHRCLKYLESAYQDDRYPSSDDGLGVYCIPCLMCTLYYFLKSPYDFEATVANCLRLGGQNDTTVFLAGALSGSLVGLEALPSALAKNVFGSEEILRQANSLFRSWRRRDDTEDVEADGNDA